MTATCTWSAAGTRCLRTVRTATGLGPGQTLYTSLDQLARQVRAAGVTDGDRVGGRRREPLRPAADGADLGPQYTRPKATWRRSSALEVNDGAARPPPRPPPTGASASALVAAEARQPGGAGRRHLRRPAGRGRGAGAGAADHREGAGRYPGPDQHRQPAPRSDEVDAMLTVSDDTAAELFTKELGYQATGAGTTAAGVAAIRADLAADGLPVSAAGRPGRLRPRPRGSGHLQPDPRRPRARGRQQRAWPRACRSPARPAP